MGGLVVLWACGGGIIMGGHVVVGEACGGGIIVGGHVVGEGYFSIFLGNKITNECVFRGDGMLRNC